MNILPDKPILKLELLSVNICYLCSTPLSGKTTKDHIIPQKLFAKGSANKPYLFVHEKCNSDKSALDRRAVYRILMTCGLDPEAQKKLIAFLKSATDERNTGFDIDYGQKNYRLGKTLVRGMSKLAEIGTGDDALVMIRTGDGHVKDLHDYAEIMSTGLFVRNVKGTVPPKPKISIADYRVLKHQGGFDKWLEVLNLLRVAAGSDAAGFGQSWGPNLNYCGLYDDLNVNQAIIYIELFGSMGIKADFRTSN